MTLSDIADLRGHVGTSVTDKVFRRQLRPVLLREAIAMDRILPGSGEGSPGGGAAITQSVAQETTKAISIDGKWPLT